MPNIYVDTPDTKAEHKKKKPIKLAHCINTHIALPELSPAVSKTSDYDHIRLIQKADSELHYDIIQCWYNEVILTYLGHWNDGVIE